MSRSAVALLLLFTGCLSTVDVERPVRVAIVAVHAPSPLPLDAAIELEMSGPIRAPGVWPIHVTRADGRDQPVEIELIDPRVVAMRPVDRWPSADYLTVTIATGLVDVEGQPIALPEQPIAIETAPAPQIGTFSLEGPRPGSLAPVNLRTVVLATRGVAPPMDAIMLVAPGQALRAPIVASDGLGHWLAELPVATGGLRANQTYRLDLLGEAEPSTRPEGEITTGTVADDIAPEIRLRAVDRGGGHARLSIEASEPVLIRGALIDGDGHRVELTAPVVPLARVDGTPSGRLEPGTIYSVHLEGRDLAGNVAPALEVGLEAPGDVRVSLTELVPTPLHDWNDGAEGVAFDGTPGHGSVTDVDEWIELVNRSEHALDLNEVDLTLRVLDATPTEHSLSASSGMYFGRGGTPRAWGVGEALVVRPRSAIAQRDVVVEVAWGDLVLDRVKLGRDEDADHVGGAPPDLEHEALSRDTDGRWRWCRPSPGDPQSTMCLR